jgi:RHS repeat-associated protein
LSLKRTLEANTEYAPGSALAATSVRGLDLLFQDRSGTRSYFVKDDLGSTRALTNSSGAITDTYTYDAYGELLNSTGSTTNPYLFAGERFDPTLQQYLMGARDYNPSSGGFTSRDTFDGHPNDPITLNSYIYAGEGFWSNVAYALHALFPFPEGPPRRQLEGYWRHIPERMLARWHAARGR